MVTGGSSALLVPQPLLPSPLHTQPHGVVFLLAAATTGGFISASQVLRWALSSSQAAPGQQEFAATSNGSNVFSNEPQPTPASTHGLGTHLSTTKQVFHCSLPRYEVPAL